jgi:hypothetical protein
MKYIPKCEYCGKVLSLKNYVIIEESTVCNNPRCIKQAEEDAWDEGDK